MGLIKVFYLTNVTYAVNLSQPSVCIGGGLHAPIRIFEGSTGPVGRGRKSHLYGKHIRTPVALNRLQRDFTREASER